MSVVASARTERIVDRLPNSACDRRAMFFGISKKPLINRVNDVAISNASYFTDIFKVSDTRGQQHVVENAHDIASATANIPIHFGFAELEQFVAIHEPTNFVPISYRETWPNHNQPDHQYPHGDHSPFFIDYGNGVASEFAQVNEKWAVVA